MKSAYESILTKFKLSKQEVKQGFFVLEATPGAPTVFIAKRGAVPTHFTLAAAYDNQVFVPLFEIACIEADPKFERYWRRRAVEKIHSMIEKEVLNALDASIEPHRVVTVTGEIKIEHFNLAMTLVEDQECKVDNVVMNTRATTKFLEELNDDSTDKSEAQRKLEERLKPYVNTAKLLSSTACSASNAFFLPEPDYLGVIGIAERPQSLTFAEAREKLPDLARALPVDQNGVIGYARIGICVAPQAGIHTKIVTI